MTHSLHEWLHDERSTPPIMPLTCVPPVGLEPTALGLGIVLSSCVCVATCCFVGDRARISGMSETGGQQFAPRVAPRVEQVLVVRSAAVSGSIEQRFDAAPACSLANGQGSDHRCWVISSDIISWVPGWGG